MMANMKYKMILLISYFTIFITMGIYFFISIIDLSSNQNYKKEVSIGESNGSNIVSAIENYFIDHNKYPESVNELVPEYVKSIPKTFSGADFSYYLSETDIYVVSFSLESKNNNYLCGYIKKLENWECSGVGK